MASRQTRSYHGQEVDSVQGLATLYHARETFGLPIQTASLDKAHDALGLFRLATNRWHMTLVIPINERNKGNLPYAGPLRIREDGVPLGPKHIKRHGSHPRSAPSLRYDRTNPL